VADVRFLLWDFGDTLADERWLWACPPGVLDWADGYRTVVSSDFGARWNRGAANLDELAAELSARLGMSTETVLAHVRCCCREIRFFEHAWATARSRALPQALVTVNADLFGDFIVPDYRLADIFDVVVVSAEEGTDSKVDLCEAAVDRLGCDDPAQALLIDNIEANVDAWRARGGAAYWFRGDEEFAARFSAGGWDGLAEHS
jgi:FMN phosphatase YigB (HAD superfamily)